MGQQQLDAQVVIIGTGFAGMGIAIALDRAGISNYILLEKSADIGGTWRDNQYPGACCDVPSQLYSFSFELNPDWSHRFSPAGEIHAYQQRVMDKYQLRERTRTGFEAESVTYTDQATWLLTSTCGKQVLARYVVTASGTLHVPHKPSFAGMEHFAGKLMHSAEWDNTCSLDNKKIIVVGSAASAIQILPPLAKVANHVTVMQRTANYFVPRKDRGISGFEKWWLRKLPFIPRLIRWRQYCFNDFLFYANFKNKPSFAKSFVRRLVGKHLQQVKNPQLRRKLTPDYAIGCKRLLLSDDFLPALQQDNVTLVTEGIDHFTESGLVTRNGTDIEADLVVMATGFQATKLFGEMHISGPNGLTMEQAWAEEIRAHRSVAVKGFPNFFIMYGPNSNLGHSSIIIMIEAQARYIARLLKHAAQLGKPNITVRPEAEAAYNKRIQKALQGMVWSGDCSSWYKDGKGHIFSLWPYSTTRFIRELRKAPLNEYTFT